MAKRPGYIELRVYLDEEVHTEFKVRCAQKRISMSSLIKEWVDDWLEYQHQLEEQNRPPDKRKDDND